MGFRVSWLAAQGGKQQLLDGLGLVDTGEEDEVNEAPFSVAELPAGWTVVWANDESFANDYRAASLSRSGQSVLSVNVNETCMHSTAAFHTAGKQIWRLHHEGDERTNFLEKEGELPAAAAEIEALLRARQVEEDAGAAQVDYLFEVPLKVAQALSGFKHDMFSFDWGEPSFTVARPAVAGNQRSGFFGRLFSSRS